MFSRLFRHFTFTEIHVGAATAIWTWIFQGEKHPLLPFATGLGALAFYQADHLYDARRARRNRTESGRDFFYHQHRHVFTVIVALSSLSCLALLLLMNAEAWLKTILPSAAGTMAYIMISLARQNGRMAWRTILIAWVFACTTCGLPLQPSERYWFSGLFISAVINVSSIRTLHPILLLLAATGTGVMLAILTLPTDIAVALGALCISQALPCQFWKGYESRAAGADWMILVSGLSAAALIKF